MATLKSLCSLTASGRFLPLTKGCTGPILLKKSVFSNCQDPDQRSSPFCALLLEIFVGVAVWTFKISTSCAYFSAVKTAPDCFQQSRSKAAFKIASAKQTVCGRRQSTHIKLHVAGRHCTERVRVIEQVVSICHSRP